MKWILLLLVSTVTWAGGWETSRFFVQINGGDVGTLTISRLAGADTITTRTESTLEITRGGQKLAMSESTESVSRLDGSPVSLSYEMDQGGMRLAFTATFDRDNIRIRGEDGRETVLKRPANLLLDGGMTRLLLDMIRSGAGKTVVSSLFPASRATIPRTVAYQGTMETEHGTFHRFRIADQVGAMELV